MSVIEEATGLPSEAAMRRFLQRVLPGRSRRIAQLREGILHFSASPTARTVLLQGPIGAGKSTVARSMALLKRVAPLRAEVAGDILENVKLEAGNLIQLNSLPWYVELPLTGLVAQLVDVQLFGSKKGGFTDAVARAGVFEQAMFGRRKRSDLIPEAVRMTGGIVFLDEVGELTAAHQAKLLPVLSGGPFYRVGAEGEEGEDLVFRGSLLTASWRDLDGVLRADLMSRIGSNRLRVPGLDERMEDFDDILKTLEGLVRGRIEAAIDHITLVEPDSDKEYWAQRRDAIPRLSEAARRQLARVDWSDYGNLRGLTAVIEQVVDRGSEPEQAIAQLSPVRAGVDRVDAIEVLLDGLRHRQPSDDGLAGHIGALELEHRASLRERLLGDPALFEEIAETLGIGAEKLREQARQLDRIRRAKS